MKLMKIFRFLERVLITKLIYINTNLYIREYTKYLKKIGINIIGSPKFINNDTYFDGSNYSLITLGDNITISREVMFLTHDYSITTAIEGSYKNGKKLKKEVYFSKAISIGNNCFIGARSSILPGTEIGNNVIVGANSVVKGKIPDDSIIIGNPAKIIGNTSVWVKQKVKHNEYLEE